MKTESPPQIRGGYYIKARCIQNSEIAIMSPYVREIWDWLLKEANHKDVRRAGIIIKRGQLIRTFKDIREGLHWKIGYRKMSYKKWQCENAMKFLREQSMITTTKTTRGMLINICNYDYYQNPKNYESNKRTTTKATREQQLTDTINKNVKNVKNVKNNTITVLTDKDDKIYFDFNLKTWINMVPQDFEMWEEAYPVCDIDLELKQMAQWLLANPKKRKKNYRRFITNWLTRSQDRGGTKKGNKKENERKIFEQAIESLNIYYSKNKLLAWLSKLPQEYHTEFQKYPHFEDVEQKLKEHYKQKGK